MKVAALLCCCVGLFAEVKVEKGICWIDGQEYPAVGFGTYPLFNEECSKAVEKAGELGYRIIDTAAFYNNFEALSRGLKKLGREKFYLISKVWHDQQQPEDLKKDLAATLKRLGTDSLDAYLLHWPNSAVPIEGTLQAMAELKKEGKIRHIGISNPTANHLRRALETGVEISWVQVEMSPLFYDPELLQFCQEKGIGVQAWSPVGRGGLGQDPMLLKIGKKYGKTPCQVALRWILQHGCVSLPNSKNEKHMEENQKVLDFTLNDAEMAMIDDRAKKGERFRVTEDFLGFNDEFDFTYDQCWPRR